MQKEDIYNALGKSQAQNRMRAAWMTHVRPEKCGHYSPMALLGAVGHEVVWEESVTALQGSEGRQVRFESHIHPLALDSKQST